MKLVFLSILNLENPAMNCLLHLLENEILLIYVLLIGATVTNGLAINGSSVDDAKAKVQA